MTDTTHPLNDFRPMTLTRRHMLAGAASTVAAAALPAVAVAETLESCDLAEPTSSCVLYFTSTDDFLDFIAAGIDSAEIVTAHPYMLADIPEVE